MQWTVFHIISPEKSASTLLIHKTWHGTSTSVITRNRILSRAKGWKTRNKNETCSTSNGADHKIDCSFNPFLVKISISFLDRLETYGQNQNPFREKPRVKPTIMPGSVAISYGVSFSYAFNRRQPKGKKKNSPIHLIISKLVIPHLKPFSTRLEGFSCKPLCVLTHNVFPEFIIGDNYFSFCFLNFTFVSGWWK